MTEPIGRDPRPPRNEPRTLNFDKLLKSDLFERRNHEQGPWQGELKRNALVKVLDETGKPRQFIITILLDLYSKMLSVTIEPTQGAVQDDPELNDVVNFTGLGQQTEGVASVIQQAVKKMGEAGYQLDPVALQMLHAG